MSEYGNYVEQAAFEDGLAVGRAEARLAEIASWAFEQGYVAGHNDTVEGCFSLDEKTVSEDWLLDVQIDGSFEDMLNREKADA